jgi:hypothetical protein
MSHLVSCPRPTWTFLVIFGLGSRQSIIDLWFAAEFKLEYARNVPFHPFNRVTHPPFHCSIKSSLDDSS